MRLLYLYEYVKINNFQKLTTSEIKKIFKLKEHKIFFKQLKENFNSKSYQQSILLLTDAYENDLTTFIGLKNFINEKLLDKEFAVSPSKLGIFQKINETIKEQIFFHTATFPKEISCVGRCELIRKNIKTFPKCLNCKVNDVSWTNAATLLTYCSVKCGNTSIVTKESRINTNIEKYGAPCYFGSESGKQKIKDTNIEKYGVPYFLCRGEHYKKIDDKILERYGVLNNLSSKESRNKLKKTMLERYGVESYTLAEDFQDKARVAKAKSTKPHKQVYYVITKRYKTTELYYQGSYELYFLELLETKNLLHFIKRGKSIIYSYENNFHLYHPDFELNGKLIEIKSNWTYNKHGKDLKLQERNDTKWKAARDIGFNLTVLFNKKQIKQYVEGLNNV